MLKSGSIVIQDLDFCKELSDEATTTYGGQYCFPYYEVVPLGDQGLWTYELVFYCE